MPFTRPLAIMPSVCGRLRVGKNFFHVCSIGRGLAFRKEQREAAPGIIASAIVWESTYIETTADETLTANDGGGGRTAKEDAADFLEDLLGRGPIDLLDVEEQARA